MALTRCVLMLDTQDRLYRIALSRRERMRGRGNTV
jgi:hypothetical protein